MNIGIDLGTTNTVVAYIENGSINYLRFRSKDSLTSVMLYQTGAVIVGEKAKAKSVLFPANYIKSSKTYLADSSKQWNIEDRTFTPTDVATEILSEIVSTLRKKFEDTNEFSAVITVPAYFTSSQIDETKRAAEKSGLTVSRIITEPVAAAIAYGVEDNCTQKLFIVDIGGGTFDTAILDAQGNSFNTCAIDGDNHLGGDDFDNHILDHLLSVIRKDKGVNLASQEKSGLEESEYRTAYQTLVNKSEEIKIELSNYEKYEVEVPNLISGYNFKTSLTREQFESFSSVTFEKIERIIKRTLDYADIDTSDIDKVVLVGGTARIPRISSFVETLFEKKPYSDKPLDKLVAIGAAILADDKETIQVRDILSHSLGIELINDKFEPLLKKNQQYPTSFKNTFTTTCDFQKEIAINVYEGEKSTASENDFYGGFNLLDIENAPAGVPKIEVTFNFDRNRILKVTARDLKTNASRSEEIEIDKGSKKKLNRW